MFAPSTPEPRGRNAEQFKLYALPHQSSYLEHRRTAKRDYYGPQAKADRDLNRTFVAWHRSTKANFSTVLKQIVYETSRLCLIMSIREREKTWSNLVQSVGGSSHLSPTISSTNGLK